VVARSNGQVCGRSLAGTVGSNPAGGMDVSLVGVVCCQVEVSAASLPLIQRISTEFGVSDCDLETSTRRRPRPEYGCWATGTKKLGGGGECREISKKKQKIMKSAS
jgi:hypothetical protein